MEELAGKLPNYIPITTEDKEVCTTSEDRSRTTTTDTTGKEEEEVLSPLGIFDMTTEHQVLPAIIEDKSNHNKFTATINTNEKKSSTTSTTGAEEDEVRHTIDDATVDDKVTTSTTTTEEDPSPTKTRPTTKTPPKMKTTGEEEFPIPSSMFDIDNTFTTSNITEEEEDEESTNYYDNIDNKIFRNEESTIVFEDNSLVPSTVHTDSPNIIIDDLLTTKRLNTIVDLLKEDTLDFVIGILSDNPLDDHTREVVCGVLMEVLLSKNDVVDGVGVCDSLFALLDMDKHDDNHIPGRSDHLLFTAAQRVVPIQYPIKITKPTAMNKLLDAEHNEFLKQGTSKFLELPKHIQEYLRQKQIKQKQHMIDIQAPYTVAAYLKKTMKEHIRK